MKNYKAKSTGNHITGYFRENTILMATKMKRWRWRRKGVPQKMIRIIRALYEDAITKWQRRLNKEDRKTWTTSLISDIRPLIGQKFRRWITTLHRCYRVTDILENICIEWAKLHPPTVFTTKRKQLMMHSLIIFNCKTKMMFIIQLYRFKCNFRYKAAQ